MFNQKSEKLTPQQQMLSDPTAMTNMMKNNLGMMVPQARARSRSPVRLTTRTPDALRRMQMLTMAWVNFFFSGFVVAKVPFPLTQRFRGMLQRGVDLQSLDVTYVSSLSWYFLNVFGLNGLLQLILGEASTVNDIQAQQQMMMMARLLRAACLCAAPADASHRGWTPPRRTSRSVMRWRRCATSGRCQGWRLTRRRG